MRGVRKVTTGAVAALCMLGALLPGAAVAASITGTVSAESTHVGIAGVEVCLTPQPYTFEVDCVETDSGGHYEIGELRATQYRIGFSAFRNNLRYVSEFYDDVTYYEEADLVSVAWDEARVLDVELAEGGSISGTVTDETTGQPIAGLHICATGEDRMANRCAISDANGNYTVNGLRSGNHVVEFEGGNEVNYLRELYDDAETVAQATDVPVNPPATTFGIDAEMARGAEILGHVSQVGTGIPIHDVFVCANEQDPGEHQGCDMTDADGNYAIRSLPAATYLVAFEMEYMPFGLIADQWWNGVETIEEATPIAIAPPETRTGIDGQVTRGNWGPWPAPPEPAPEASPPAPPVATTSASNPRVRKCRKGFHRRWVKGKKRCVRKHRHRAGRS